MEKDKWFWIGIFFALLIIVLFTVCLANAHVPGASQSLNAWLMSLRSRTGTICCDGRDATIVDASYTKDGHWVAVVEGREIPIPDETLVDRGNLHGEPLIWLRGGRVVCFLPGAGI